MKFVLIFCSLFLFTVHLSGAEFSQDVPCEPKKKPSSPKTAPVITTSQIVVEPKRPLNNSEKIVLETYLQKLLSNLPKKEFGEFELRYDNTYDGYLLSRRYNENVEAQREATRFYKTQLQPIIQVRLLTLTHSKTQNEWEELFKNNAHNFIKQYSENYHQLLPILTNPKMLKQILNLGKLAIENAQDVEHIVIDN